MLYFKHIVSTIWHRERGHFQVIETAVNAQGKHLAHFACEYEEADWINHEIVYALHPETTEIMEKFEGYIKGKDGLFQAHEWALFFLAGNVSKPRKMPRKARISPVIARSGRGPIDLDALAATQTEAASVFNALKAMPDAKSEIFNRLSEVNGGI